MDKSKIVTAALKLNREEVFMEDWDDSTVYIRELTAREMDAFSDMTYEMKDGVLQAKPVAAMINILFFCLVDEDDNPLFTKEELESISASVILELGLIAFDVNDLDNIDGSTEVLKEAINDLKNGKGDISITN